MSPFDSPTANAAISFLEMRRSPSSSALGRRSAVSPSRTTTTRRGARGRGSSCGGKAGRGRLEQRLARLRGKKSECKASLSISFFSLFFFSLSRRARAAATREKREAVRYVSHERSSAAAAFCGGQRRSNSSSNGSERSGVERWDDDETFFFRLGRPRKRPVFVRPRSGAC